MQRSIKRLLGYTLKETSGKIGELEEFYFDDQNWTIQYVIVKTGSWPLGKKVLISPTAYWGNKSPVCDEIFEMMPDKLYEREDKHENNFKKNDKHLKSTEEITGYSTYATDGRIGKVYDYIFDDITWKIKFFVIDTGIRFANRKVLLATKWIHEVNWDNSKVMLDIAIEEVKNSPELTYK